MKHYNLLLWITGIMVIIGVVMRITHIPGAYYLIIWALIGSIFVQNAHIKKQYQRITELESEVRNRLYRTRKNE